MDNLDSANFNNSDSTTCSICTCKFAKYTCPRCCINYCSLGCYRDRRHGKCSEQFYRECCEQAAADLKIDNGTREQIARMIDHETTNFGINEVSESSNADDENDANSEESDEESDELINRLKDIDLTAENFDVTTVWSRLTIDEKRDFHRQLTTGKIYSSIPVWTPWWQAASKELINSFPDDADDDNENEQIPPATPLAKYISSKPHPSVVFALSEVLLGFTFISRYVNGDYLTGMCLESCDLLLKIITCLRGPQRSSLNVDSNKKTRIINAPASKTSIIPAPVFANFEEVLASFQAQLALNGLTCSLPVLLLASDDLLCLLKNPQLLRRSLFEVETMIKQATIHVRHSSQLLFARHKLAFFRACVENESWAGDKLLFIQQTVSTSMCSQTVRIESEKIMDGEKKTRTGNFVSAGFNWRQIVRPTPVDASINQLHPLIQVNDI